MGTLKKIQKLVNFFSARQSRFSENYHNTKNNPSSTKVFALQANFLRKTGQKFRYWAFFEKFLFFGLYKISTCWPPLDERVRSSFCLQK